MAENKELPAHSSLIGGSSASKRLNCPGSYELELPFAGENNSSEFARVGTGLHNCMEEFLNEVEDWEGLRAWALGEKFPTDEGYDPLTIDADHVTYKLEPALEAVNDIAYKVGDFEFFETEAKAKFTLLDDAFGTVDVLAKAGNTCCVLDYKFGDGVAVKCKGNDQLMFYAAAVLFDPDFADFVEGVDTFFLAIIQPKNTDTDVEQYYEEWIVKREQVESFAKFVVESMKRVGGKNAVVKSGAHCRWCKAKTVCPEFTKGTAELVKVDTKGELSATEIGVWLKTAERAKQLIKEIETRAHEEMERGVQIPGYKLVRKRATRKYIDEDSAEKVLVEAIGDGAFTKKLLSPAQAEKEMGKKQYKEVLGKEVHSISSGTTIAPDSDKREDVSNTMNQLGDKLKLKANKTKAKAKAKAKGEK